MNFGLDLSSVKPLCDSCLAVRPVAGEIWVIKVDW